MKAYQLKITIKNSKPPIWRKIIVPERITFEQLHLTIQSAFGWMNSHIFEFEFSEAKVRVVDNLEETEIFDDYDFLDARKETIDQLIRDNTRFQYIYDFGDWWEHRIEVENILEDYEHRYPCVIKHRGNGIPEDCGGINGYYQLLDDLANVKGKQREELMDWAVSQGLKEYDVSEVNDYMKRKLTFPVVKAKGKKEKPSNIDESMKEFWEFMHTVEKKETLNEIYSYYTKDEIKMIAKIHDIRNISKYNKEQLIEHVIGKILEEERMERYFLTAKDYVVEAFEEALEDAENPLVDITRDFDYIFDGGYCGISNQMKVIVPTEVKQVYEKINNPQFHEKRKRICTIMNYCHIANFLYAVTPLNIIVDTFNRYEKEKTNEEEVMSIYHEILPSNRNFICLEEMFVEKNMVQNGLYSRLLKEQTRMPFYIPNKKEIKYYFENECMPTPDEYKDLYKFLLEDLKVDYYEEAYEICQVIHLIIKNGCRLQDLFDFFENQEIYLANKKQVERLTAIFTKLWNSTKMIINRGNSPNEVILLNKKKEHKTSNLNRPSNPKVVPFPKRDEKGEP